ncbi:hypothetical protein HYY69_07710 [Candidatus Woesearchaeota archaeon]|nr:hypothetical protein [Candidatus Woesearchaeota archaeon]
MGEPFDILVAKFEIKSTDKIVINKVYIALHDYFYREEYSKGRDAEFPETFMFETRTQKGGKEIWVWWRPEKDIKGNSFVKKKFVFDIHGVGLTEVELIKQNFKFKAVTGKVEFLVKAKLEVDVKERFRNNPFLAPIFSVFWKRLYRKQLEQHKLDMLKDAYKLQEFVKRQMELNTFVTPIQPFAPALGFPDQNF